MIVRLLIALLLVCCLTGRPAEADPLPFSGIWEGSSGGDDRATWTARVDVDGNVRVAGVSRNTGRFTATGWVTRRGDLAMETAGTASTFATFNGRFSGTDRVSGTWRNRVLGGSGTFTGRRTSATAIPGECLQLYGVGQRAPTGYGLAYDPINPSRPLLIRGLGCATANARISIGGGEPTQLIYRYGYEYRNGRWVRITLQGTAGDSTDWLVGSATAVVTRTTTALAAPNLVVAFICTWTGNTWQCGCTDDVCSGSAWQLQAFRRR